MPYKDPDKYREYRRVWAAKRRAEFFAGKSCVQCGSTHRLELDHVDPAEKVSHRIWTWSEKRRLEETAKCQVLCYDCHLKKTKKQLKVQHPCGVFAKYQQGCRCAKCRASNTQYKRDRRALGHK